MDWITELMFKLSWAYRNYKFYIAKQWAEVGHIFEAY